MRMTTIYDYQKTSMAKFSVILFLLYFFSQGLVLEIQSTNKKSNPKVDLKILLCQF